jgi:UDP-N-acetylglucosamine--dolichyl-phosphate N-acetylglucosaminephosphotransferase
MISVVIIPTIIFSVLISAILTRILIPWILKASLDRGITTVDAHKKNTPIIAEAGGLAPLLAFIFTVLVIIFGWAYLVELQVYPFSEVFKEQTFEPLLAGVLSVVIAGLIGFFDDVFKIRWRDKILLGFLPAIPLMALKVGNSSINLGFLGIIDFTFAGLNLYSLIIIPLAVNFAFNSFNMLAGFNGLETGNGVISLIGVLFISFLVNDPIVSLFTSALLGGFLVLLRYNWYPAKILVGDTGTLTLGTGIIVALIIGNMNRIAVGAFGLHFINFIMFLAYIATKQEGKIATIDENENIIAPCPYTVYWIIPYFFKNINERKNVIFILLIHSAILMLVLILSLPIFFSY